MCEGAICETARERLCLREIMCVCIMCGLVCETACMRGLLCEIFMILHM